MLYNCGAAIEHTLAEQVLRNRVIFAALMMTGGEEFHWHKIWNSYLAISVHSLTAG